MGDKGWLVKFITITRTPLGCLWVDKDPESSLVI